MADPESYECASCVTTTTPDGGLFQDESIFLCWSCFQALQDSERRQDMGDHYILTFQDDVLPIPPQLEDDDLTGEEEEEDENEEEEEEEVENEEEEAVQAPYFVAMG